MELTEDLKALLIDTATMLKGADRRRFIAQTVQARGYGGQFRAEQELHGNRATIRKSILELTHGMTCLDAFQLRGRKSAEAHLPHVLEAIRAIVDRQSQTDPQFRTNRLYTRITVAKLRRQLIAEKGYTDAEVPTERTILTKLNDLGYHLTKVANVKPQKKS